MRRGEAVQIELIAQRLAAVELLPAGDNDRKFGTRLIDGSSVERTV